jgi:hypothetical protein
MNGSRIGLTIRAVISLVLIVAIYVIDIYCFNPVSAHNFLSVHTYLHKILLLVLVALAGTFTFIIHPARWTLTLWLSCYALAIIGLIIFKALFLFISDPYHLQHHAFDFVQRYLLSFLPFLGLYILGLVINRSMTAK